MIEEQNIIFQLKAKTKVEAIEKLVKVAFEKDKVSNIDNVVKSVLNREEESTTGFGKGIAIPHGKSDSVKEPTLMFARTEEGLEWNSMDGAPVEIIFLILVPEESHNDHLKLLSQLARKLMHNDFVANLREIQVASELVTFLKKELA